MSPHDTFGRILLSLNDAMLDDAHWATASLLVDEACGMTGSELVVGEGFGSDVRIHYAGFYCRGERCQDLERSYFEVYHPFDERLPRLRLLPDSQLVHVTDLYTDEELKTSAAYNEGLRRSGAQNSLNVRLDGLNGSRIVWALTDPIGGTWGSAQTEMIERLLPHIRQYVQVRSVVAGAEALGASLTGLLDNARVGAIHLDRRGRISEANDRARKVLRRGNGLFDEGGFLRARLPSDNDRLAALLGQALPRYGEAATSGSLMLQRPSGLPRLAVHISPVSTAQADFVLTSAAALVLVVDPASRPKIDPALVAAALELTPSQSQVAVMLAEGRSVRDIAGATGRQASTVRQFLKQIYTRRGLTGRADLVRLVLSLSDLPGSGD